MIVLTISACFTSTGIIGLTFLEVCPDLYQSVSLAKILMKMSQSVAKVYQGMIALLS